MVAIAGDRGGNMSDDNKIKLGEQLVRCVLDDKLPVDKKLRKMDYIIKLGADVNAECGLGYSVLGLAKLVQNDEVIKFLEERGAEDIGFDKEKAEEFFKTASIEEINNVLKVLPDGYKLDCDVDLSERGLTELPDFSRLVVGGNFNCQYNELETLKGAPSKVGDNFDCSDNQLTSLEGAPREVGEHFICQYNLLTSLEGASSKVGGTFVCSFNNLTSLKGAPREVGVNFNCQCNQLETLEGGPRIVGGNFYCDYNSLKSYKGKPDKIGGEFVVPKIEQVSNINAGNSR